MEKQSDKYISIGDAALLAGLTRDYVSRLCRTKKVHGELVRNQWRVDPNSLHAFIVSQENLRQERRVMLAKERSNEYRTASVMSVAETSNFVADSAQKTISPAPDLAATFATHVSNISSGLGQAALHVAQVSPSTLTYTSDVLHKVASLVLVGTIVVGTYTAVNPTGTRQILGMASTPHATVVAPVQQPLQGDISNTASAAMAAVTATSSVSSADNSNWFSRTVNALLSASLVPFRFLADIFGGQHQTSGTVAVEVVPAAPVAASQSGTWGSSPAQTVTNNTYNNTYNTTNNKGGNTYNNYSVGSIGTPSADISESELQSKLNAFASALQFQSYPNGTPSTGGAANNIALLQNIDNLTGTHLSNITVNGVSGLQPSDIPNLSASYLAVSGGTLTGLLNDTATGLSSFAGGLSVDTLNVSSTTATSTFANGINLASGCFAINGNCAISSSGVAAGGIDGNIQFNNGGILSGASAFTYSSSTGAVAMNSLQAGGITTAQPFTFTTSSGSTATSSTFYSYSSSSTSVYATNGSIGSVDVGVLAAATGTIMNLFASNLRSAPTPDF